MTTYTPEEIARRGQERYEREIRARVESEGGTVSAENKTLVRRWFEEVWNKGRGDAIDEMLGPDSVHRGLGQVVRGPEEFRPFYAAFRDAFPDLKIRVEDVIAEGDTVACRWTATGTHLGSGLGFPATGKQVEFLGLGLVHVKDGKLVEGWNSFDQLG